MPKKSGAKSSKEDILQAYLKIFYNENKDSPTLQELAKASGLSYFGVHYHYGKNRQELQLDTIHFVTNAALEFIVVYLEKQKLTPQRSPLENYILGTFQWAHTFPEMSSFWLYQYSLAMRKKTHKEIHGLLINEARMRIQNLLREGMREGFHPSLVQLPELATKIHAFLVGGVIMAATESLSKDALKKLINEQIKGIFNVLSAHKI